MERTHPTVTHRMRNGAHCKCNGILRKMQICFVMISIFPYTVSTVYLYAPITFIMKTTYIPHPYPGAVGEVPSGVGVILDPLHQMLPQPHDECSFHLTEVYQRVQTEWKALINGFCSKPANTLCSILQQSF